MKDVFIHKPLGVTINAETRKLLKSKYTGFWEFVQRKSGKDDSNVLKWYVPEKIILYKEFDDEINNKLGIFEDSCESIIYMSGTNHAKSKISSIYLNSETRQSNNSDWIIGLFPLTIENLFKDSFNGKKYDQSNSSTKFFNDYILGKLSNSSILNIVRMLYCEYNLESVLISNGIINKFLKQEYKEDGVFYSSLAFEDTLPAEKVTKLATILTWIESQKKEVDIAQTFAKLLATPQKLLKNLAQKNKIEEFVDCLK